MPLYPLTDPKYTTGTDKITGTSHIFLDSSNRLWMCNAEHEQTHVIRVT